MKMQASDILYSFDIRFFLTADKLPSKRKDKIKNAPEKKEPQSIRPEI